MQCASGRTAVFAIVLTTARMVEHVSSLTRWGLCVWQRLITRLQKSYVMLCYSVMSLFISISRRYWLSDDRSQCWWITVLLINTRLHHSVVLILKSTTSYTLLRTEICIINRVIRQHISKTCHLMVDQSIFQQLAMIIIQKFSSAATFFYFYVFLVFGVCLLCYTFCHHFSFFFNLQTIFYFSSPVIMQAWHGIVIFPYLALKTPYTLKNLHCVHSGFYHARASDRLLEWAREVMKEQFY
jgi:hypothetical protein